SRQRFFSVVGTARRPAKSSQAVEQRHQLAEFVWLLHVTVGTQLVTLRDVLHVDGAAEHDDRQVLEARILAKLSKHLLATHPRQVEVEQNPLGILALS